MMLRYLLSSLLVLLGAVVFLQIGEVPGLSRQLALIGGQPADSFADFEYSFARLPRLTMALLVGATLGLIGSLIQQLTRNPLLSPMTLGCAGGAWLALVCLNIWLPALVAGYSALFAMAGATAAMALVLLIAGPRNLGGLPVVLAGMAVNILLGAITTAIILLHDQYARGLFIWGAGDLSQNGWDQVHWLLPRLSAVLIIVLFGPRVLTLLRLGQQGAAARGLNVTALFAVLIICGLWLLSAAITMVGVIGFVGLLTPNIARALGTRRAGDELAFSALLGALVLIFTDGLALWLSQHSVELVPSGITAALIGAPALLWFSRRQLSAADQLSFRLPAGASRLTPLLIGATVVALLVSSLLTVFVSQTDSGWLIGWPDTFSWSLRWPRLTTALSAGAAMAVAGVILQRLIHNPLASPDLLGMSAGAVLALVMGSLTLGTLVQQLGPLLAFAGSMLVLAILLLLGRRQQYAPAVLLLTGIALSALIEAIVQFALIRGDEQSYSILRWLAGSTYRVESAEAVTLLAGTLVLLVLAGLSQRWLTLISAGRDIALARGLPVNRCFVLLLILAAMLCALVTALMGPVAFVGLIAPHMAAMLGARSAPQQLAFAALLGATLLQLADWLGQQVIWPMQLAAGTMVALIGGSYFILLLVRGRRLN